MPRASRVVVLDFELAEIRNAVTAAAVLLDMLVISQFPNEETERLAPAAALGVLNLVSERILQIDRCLRGDVDPRLLLSSFNSMPDGGAVTRDRLLVLRPWVRINPRKAKRSKRSTRKPKSHPIGMSHPEVPPRVPPKSNRGAKR